MILRYTKGVFPKNPGPTIGVEYDTKTYLLKNGGDGDNGNGGIVKA